MSFTKLCIRRVLVSVCVFCPLVFDSVTFGSDFSKKAVPKRAVIEICVSGASVWDLQPHWRRAEAVYEKLRAISSVHFVVSDLYATPDGPLYSSRLPDLRAPIFFVVEFSSLEDFKRLVDYVAPMSDCGSIRLEL